MMPKKLSKISNGVIKKPKIIFSLLLTTYLMFGLVMPALAACPGEPTELACGTQGRKIKQVCWLAAIGIPDGLLIPKNCLCGADVNTCGLNQILQAVINFVTIIVGVTGSVALLMFTYGGVMFIIAAGNQERITKAKQILGAAAIGIIIIFTAWLIVNFVILTLTKGEVGSSATIFDQGWSEPQNIKSSGAVTTSPTPAPVTPAAP